jgi:hypothetical protein
MMDPCLDPSKVSLKDIFGRYHRLFIFRVAQSCFSLGWAAMALAAAVRFALEFSAVLKLSCREATLRLNVFDTVYGGL